MGRAGRGKHRRSRGARVPFTHAVASPLLGRTTPPARPRATTTTRFGHRHAGRLSRRAKIVSGLVGVTLVGGAAYATTSWVTGLNAGSSAEGQAATAANLTFAAVASPSASNLLYPGGTGDVVVTITNPNVFPVTVSGVDLPTNTTYATGYTASNLTGSISGCSSSTSDVLWDYATSSSGSVHSLTTALTVAASGTLTVTLTNDASMTTSAPAACEGAYFSMPSLTGIVASGGSATATPSPATDAWTS
jgi:hypothetical protein